MRTCALPDGDIANDSEFLNDANHRKSSFVTSKLLKLECSSSFIPEITNRPQMDSVRSLDQF